MEFLKFVPIFCDILADTLCMDWSLSFCKESFEKQTIAVHQALIFIWALLAGGGDLKND